MSNAPPPAELSHLVSLFNTGRYDELEAGARRLVGQYPDSGVAWKVLGVALKVLGKDALPALEKATQLRPDDAEAQFNLGAALQAGGQLPAAVAAYRRALALKPGFDQAHYNLGSALHELGQFDAAAASYREALARKPDFAEAHNNLGVTLQASGQPDAALGSYRRALALKPDFAEAHNNLGATLHALGQLDAGAASYRQALAIRPGYAEAHKNLGATLHGLGQFDEALLSHRQALALKPDFAEAWSNLGVSLQELGRFEESVASYRRALALRPEAAETHYNLGNALKDAGQFEAAAASYRNALAMRPDDARAHNNLGAVLNTLGQLDAAVANYRSALALVPGDADAHYNLAMALLAQGDLAAGWEEHEWRWQSAQLERYRRDFEQPQWRGEAAHGRTLLIHAEQGFGDTLQFCRYAPLAAARGLRIVMEVQTPLVRLLRSVASVDVVVARGEPLPAFDFHIPMLSLPWALGTTLGTIPCATAYVRADEAGAAVWRSRLADLPGQGPRVGVVWAGSSGLQSTQAAAVDRRRSLLAEQLAPLFELPGLRFFSLQKESAGAPGNFPLTDFMEEISDFADTAALIVNLDLVISVDTAVAHLAAALGRPVWLLDRHDPEWRWLRGRRDSPWYPSLRIFRQPRPGDWQAVIEEVRAELSRWALRQPQTGG
jgi:tetratricopeptide (TPR) repeat protein